MHSAIAVGLAVLFLAGAVAWRGDLVAAEFSTPARRAAARVLLIVILTLAVFSPLTNYGEAFAFDPSSFDLTTILAGHAIIATFLAAWFLLQHPAPSIGRFLSLDLSDVSSQIVTGLRVGATGWLIVITVNVTVGAFVPESLAAPPAATGEIPSIVGWIAGLPLADRLAIIVAAMSVEEAFFRGFLQPRFGAMTTNVLFAFGHFSYGLPFLVIGVFTLSVVLSRTFASERNLLSCIVAHGVFDAIQLLVILPLAVQSLAK